MRDVFPASAHGGDGHSLMPLLLALARRPRLLLGVPLLAGVFVAIVCVLSRPIYTATARILPPQYNSATATAMLNQPGGESQIGNSALTLKNPTDLFVGILNSRTILDAVIAKGKLGEYFGIAAPDDLRLKLATLTDIRAGKDGIVTITVEDHDPAHAAELANLYVDEFYQFAGSLAKQQGRLRSTFYDAALQAAQAKLAAADETLRSTEVETGFTRLRGQDEAIVQSAAELQAQVAAREVQARTMQSYASETNPDLQLVRRELANLRTQLSRLRGDGAGNHGASSAQHAEVQPPFVGVGSVPDALMRNTARKREVQYWESIVGLLGKYSELGKIDETRDLSLFQVLDRAVPAQHKSKPRTMISTMLAVIGSGTLCLLAALGQEYVQRRRALSPEFDMQWQLLAASLRPGWVARIRVPRFGRTCR